MNKIFVVEAFRRNRITFLRGLTIINEDDLNAIFI
jgi:hypothetical protein